MNHSVIKAAKAIEVTFDIKVKLKDKGDEAQLKGSALHEGQQGAAEDERGTKQR